MSTLKLRSLSPDDLERVSEIDGRITGRPRKGFFEKRLTVAMATPENFITAAAIDGEKLAGYAFARVQRGHYGRRGEVAVLDVIGVDSDAQGRGVGRALIANIEEKMKKQGIGTLRTQVSWTDHLMTRFFSSTDFTLSPSQIIERDTAPMQERVPDVNPVKMDGLWRVHSSDGSDNYETLARDRFLVRSLRQEDLASVIRIDLKHTGVDRTPYYELKFREMLIESGVRVSLVAEEEGIVAGFVMARVDYGEFGKVEKAAVIDSIGVHPAYGGSGIGHALLSQLLINLAGLQVESLRTQVWWRNSDLQRFFTACGFAPSQRLMLSKTVH